MFYVAISIYMTAQSKKTLLLLYMHVLFYLFCSHYPYFLRFIDVIINTLYAFYVLCLVALHLFVGK